jgi:hypothetical protein
MAGFASGLEMGLESLDQGQRFRNQQALQQQQIGLESERTNADLANQTYALQRQKNNDAWSAHTDQIRTLTDQAFPLMAKLASLDPSSPEAQAYQTNLQPILDQLESVRSNRNALLSSMMNTHLDHAANDAQTVDSLKAMEADHAITPGMYANSIAYKTRLDPNLFAPGPNGEPSVVTRHMARLGNAFQSGNFDGLEGTADLLFPMRGMIGHQFPSGGVISGANTAAIHYDPNNPRNLIIQPRLTVQNPDGTTTQHVVPAFGDHALTVPVDEVMARVQQLHDVAQDAHQPDNAERLRHGQSMFDRAVQDFASVGVDPRMWQFNKYTPLKDGRVEITDYQGRPLGIYDLPPSEIQKADIALKGAQTTEAQANARKAGSIAHFYDAGRAHQFQPVVGSDGRSYNFSPGTGAYTDLDGNPAPRGVTFTKPTAAQTAFKMIPETDDSGQPTGINHLVAITPDGQGGFNYAPVKQGGAGAADSAAGLMRVSSQAEYATLPSGTRYVAPDGSIRTKR